MPHTPPITGPHSIEAARQAILSAPDGYVVTFQRKITLTEKTRGKVLGMAGRLTYGWKILLAKRNRTKEQNDKMWAMLTDVKNAKPFGREYTTEQWKAVMMRSCNHQVAYLIDVNGEPFPYGYRSSRLKVKEMIDLIDCIYAFGNDHNIVWSEPATQRDDPYGSNHFNTQDETPERIAG